MRILKILLILIAIIIGLGLIIAYGVGKEDVRVERSAVVDASPEAVYYNLSHLPEWKKWSSWDQMDPNMVSEYSDPSYGVGAYHSWTSEHKNVGNGKMTITGVEENKLVQTELDFGGQGMGYSDWKVEKVEGGTKITTHIDMKMEGPLSRLMGLMMDGMIGPEFEKGIKNLGELSKTTKLPAAWRMSDFSIKEMESMPIYSITESTDLGNMSEKMGEMYGSLMGYVGKSGSKVTGQPLAIWHEYSESENRAKMECGIPVEVAKSGEGDVKASKTPAGKMLMVRYFGDYSNLGVAHEKFDVYMKANKLEPAGAPWEWYITDPAEGSDPSTWETQIYYPIASVN